MLLGPFSNLPWKTRTILVKNEDSFKGLIDAAMKSLRDGTLDKVLPVKMHYFTGQDVPVTGQHFLTYRWSETSVADGTLLDSPHSQTDPDRPRSIRRHHPAVRTRAADGRGPRRRFTDTRHRLRAAAGCAGR